MVECLVWDVSVLFCVVEDGHVKLCADVCSSSVLILVIPSCVFSIDVSYY